MSTAPDPWLQRYGVAAPCAMPPQLQRLMQHCSVRRYQERPVSEDSLLRAVAAAQSASTSSNLQLWSVIAVRDAGRKLALARLAGQQAHVRDAPLLLLWLADLSRLQRMAARQHQAVAGCDYLESFVLASIDAALATQNAAVALEEEGLGVVYIGGMRNQPEAVAQVLQLPPAAMVVFGMCVGYPATEAAASIKPRLSPAVVLHQEYYDASGEIEGVAEYDQRHADFAQAQGRNGPPWSQQSLQRMADAAALTGRDRLREALLNLGFPLR